MKALPQFHALCLGKTTASFLSFNSVEQCVQWDCGRDGEVGESEGGSSTSRTKDCCYLSLPCIPNKVRCVCVRERERKIIIYIPPSVAYVTLERMVGAVS